MASTQIEIEVKLDAERAFELPDLTGLPGVARVEEAGVHELEAFYFDTDDLRLMRTRATLRRRTGGGDAGWHLKLPGSEAGGRVEVRRALGRSPRVVPPALLGLVRSRLRGAPLAPVARLATHRTEQRLVADDGTVLALVADDVVTGEALGEEVTSSTWRELEVELVHGDRALLEAAVDVLEAAGASRSASASKVQRTLARRLAAVTGADDPLSLPRAAPSTAGDLALLHLREQAARLVATDPAVRMDADDAVHQMRVATRRLRTALSTFRPLFADDSGARVDGIRGELRWLGGVLGVARDAEVIRARLLADLAAEPVELVVGPVRRRVDTELRRDYRAAHAAAVEALDGERYVALLDSLDAFLEEPPLGPKAADDPDRRAPKLVRRAVRQVERAVAQHERAAAAERSGRSLPAAPGLEGTTADLLLHEVRKKAKRARYAAEAVRPVAGRRAKRLARAMEQLQDVLGDHQDAVVVRGVLRDLGMRAHIGGENAFSYGRLHGLAESRAGHDEAAYSGALAAARRAARRWPG